MRSTEYESLSLITSSIIIIKVNITVRSEMEIYVLRSSELIQGTGTSNTSAKFNFGENQIDMGQSKTFNMVGYNNRARPESHADLHQVDIV